MKLKLLPLVGIALFVVILSSFDAGKIMAAVGQADGRLLGVFLLFHIPIILLKARKWQIVLKVVGYPLQLGRATRCWLGGFAISLLTPGRLGDFARATYVEKTGGKLGKPILAVAVDRLVGIILLLVFSIIGVVFFVAFLQVSLGFFSFIILVFIALIAGVLGATRRNGVAFLLRPVARRVLPGKYRTDASAIFAGFYEGIAAFRAQKMADLQVVGWGLFYWLLNIVQFAVLGEALGFGVPFSYMFLVTPLIILIDTLPVSFAGLGTREALLIFLFAAVGLTAEQAIGFSLAILVLGYLPPALAGLWVWVKEPGAFVPGRNI